MVALQQRLDEAGVIAVVVAHHGEIAGTDQLLRVGTFQQPLVDIGHQGFAFAAVLAGGFGRKGRHRPGGFQQLGARHASSPREAAVIAQSRR